MSATNLLDVFNLRKHWVEEAAVTSVGAVAVTPAVVEPARLPAGTWLSTHYAFGSVLSWLELIQIIGAVGVVFGITKFLISAWVAYKKKSLDVMV